MSNDYKAAKEAFVSGTTGSSITHINLVSLVALSSVSLYSSLCTRLSTSRRINFGLSWILLVLPLLLSMTLFAERPIILSLFILIPTALLLFTPRREGGPSLPSSQPASPAVSAPKQPSRTWIRSLPALTTYRAHMMLMTILAILAVDFPVFPRSLAKCESYGLSWTLELALSFFRNE